MSNNLLTISYITNEGLGVLENSLIFADKVDRQYSEEFAVKEAKIGATCNVRRPPRYMGTFGPALNVEDTNETYLPVTLNYQFHVDVQFTTADLLLSMDRFKTRVLSPMMATIANRIDSDGLYFAYQNTALSVGTPSVAPASYKLFSDARALLANEACPAGPKNCLLDPNSMSAATDGVKGLFNPQAQLGNYVQNGMVAKNFAGLDWFEDPNVVAFTTGAQGGTPVLTANTAGAFLTSGWAQSGFIQSNGWTNSTAVIKVGDIVQIAGVFPANPQSRTQYGSALKQFVVLPPFGYTQNPVGPATPGLSFAAGTLTSGTFSTATGAYTSSGGGALSILIGECVISGGQFQNCVTTAAFVSTSALTINGGTANAAKTSPQGIVVHKNAFALAFADLPLPRGVHEAARANDPDVGMSMRSVTQYAIHNDTLPTRIDVLYGYAGLYRQLACRIAG